MTVLEAPCAGREEELAALIDGRLPDDERRELIEHMADCDVCREVFVETTRLLAEVEIAAVGAEKDAAPKPGEAPEAPAAGKVLRPAAWWQRAPAWAAPLAAAAVLAAVLVPGLLDSGGGIVPAAELVPEATSTAELAGDWIRPLWGTPRGISDASGVSLFRAGVRVVDLEVALRRDDGGTAGALAGEVAKLLADDGVLALLLESPRAAYTSLAERLGEGERAGGLLPDARAAEAELEAALAFDDDLLLDLEYRLGKWARAAWLAAAAGDAGFFARDAQRWMLRRVVKDFGDQAPEGLGEIADLAGRDLDAEGLGELRAKLESLMARLGRRSTGP